MNTADSLNCSISVCALVFTILWASSADDKLMIFYSFFLENRI